MGYLENYSNSNNGGSVNSQDSLWQMKMAAAANNSVNQLQPHMNVDRQNSYGYDPITHGGYGAVDDYAPYPHITTQSNHGDDYMRNSNNPSRQEYCNDPYAAVHKPKKRIDQHIGTYFNFDFIKKTVFHLISEIYIELSRSRRNTSLQNHYIVFVTRRKNFSAKYKIYASIVLISSVLPIFSV